MNEMELLVQEAWESSLHLSQHEGTSGSIICKDTALVAVLLKDFCAQNCEIELSVICKYKVIRYTV